MSLGFYSRFPKNMMRCFFLAAELGVRCIRHEPGSSHGKGCTFFAFGGNISDRLSFSDKQLLVYRFV